MAPGRDLRRLPNRYNRKLDVTVLLKRSDQTHGHAAMQTVNQILLIVAMAVALSGCAGGTVVLNYRVTLQSDTLPANSTADPREESPIIASHATLPQSQPAGFKSDIIPPMPIERHRVVQEEPAIRETGGWVQLRFNVDDKGKVSGAHTVAMGADSGRANFLVGIEQAATALMETWEMVPGSVNGEPATFENVETVMRFDGGTSATDPVDEETTLRCALAWTLVIVFSPVLPSSATSTSGTSC